MIPRLVARLVQEGREKSWPHPVAGFVDAALLRAESARAIGLYQSIVASVPPTTSPTGCAFVPSTAATHT
jgi:hypothetical protein